MYAVWNAPATLSARTLVPSNGSATILAIASAAPEATI